MGKKTTTYLTDDLHEWWKGSGLSTSEVFARARAASPDIVIPQPPPPDPVELLIARAAKSALARAGYLRPGVTEPDGSDVS
jgi:hypothetical protein